MTHIIKLQEPFCDPVFHGDKNFEVRFNDRGYQEGDYVKFIPVDIYGNHFPHAVEDKLYKITYVLWYEGVQEGYVVFGIKEVEQ